MKRIKFLLLPVILVVLLVIGVKVSAAETLTGNGNYRNVGWKQDQTVQEGQVLDLNPAASQGIDAVTFKVAGDVSGGISYQANTQDSGWLTSVSDGQTAGLIGQSKRLETIKMNLAGNLANNYDIYYRTNVQAFGWLGWTKNGAESGSIAYDSNINVVSGGLSIYDIQVFIVKKGAALPVTIDNSKNAEVLQNKATTPLTISGSAYVNGVGWTPTQTGSLNGGFSLGNIGQDLSGVKFSISGPNSTLGTIEYQTNTQGAWQSSVNNGQLSGTEGKSFIETLNIKITGNLSKVYAVYYSVYVKDYGWLKIAGGGANAGSIKCNKPIQQILIFFAGPSTNEEYSTSNPATTPIVYGTTNTISYSTGSTSPWAYTFYAIKPSTTTGVDTGLYTDAQGPLGTKVVIPQNTNATQYTGTVVYADKTVTLADGSNWTHINLNGTWYWINNNNLSTAAHSPYFGMTAYNHDGELRYKDNSRYSAIFEQAVQQWNTVLGGKYILPEDSVHPATLVVNDVNQGTGGAPMSTGVFIGSNIPTTGTLTVNTSIIGQNAIMADPGTIKAMFIHELGHALGLQHTGDGSADWSWGVPTDVMRTGGNPATAASESLTSQDIAAAKLIRSLKIFAPVNK